MSNCVSDNKATKVDELFETLADYVVDNRTFNETAIKTAHYCLLDSLACMALAANVPEAKNLLGNLVPGTTIPNGILVPCTKEKVDPIKAAFDITLLIRWLDYNDTWLAAEFGHPSDNLGAILSCSYLKDLAISDVLNFMIKAHEIQGVLALNNSFNEVGLDHVILVKVASVALSTHILGGTKKDIINSISQAWLDGHPLRTYRHAPNTGTRKSWAAADATSRALFLALLTLKGEMGYNSSLSAPKWGFNEVLFRGKKVELIQPLDSYVMENVLFKISFPAEFHAQTAAEAAFQLKKFLPSDPNEIEKIKIYTHHSAIKIISKEGELRNFADRDHCLQYIVAIALLHGKICSEDYQDERARNPQIDFLRSLMEVYEDKQYSQDYLDPNKRSIANRIEITLRNGDYIPSVSVEYPIGHFRRRSEGVPLLINKFKEGIKSYFSSDCSEKIIEQFVDFKKMSALKVRTFFELLT